MVGFGSESPAPRRSGWRAVLVAALAAAVVIAMPGLARRQWAGAMPHAEAIEMDVPTYIIRRTPQPIAVDGVLNEAVWRRIEPVAAFSLLDGSPPDFETEVKLCWDDRYLYVAFCCVDNDIWGTYTKRDQPLFDQEVVEIFLNPSGDLVNYFELEVSPRNVIWDGKVHSPDRRPSEKWRADPRWNCEGMLTGVRVVGTLDDRSDLDQLWTVEMAIPFDAVAGRAPTDGERWRGNLYRIDRGERDEYSCWSPTRAGLPNAFHHAERFGWFVFSAREA
ncbi:MAG TPA: carbohydrate-binding family 9-like protein [Armatimonadota bacterium]|nr:carbohydrate-binding family 9-like protein [Armatimonadota bacterium]